MPSRKLLLKMSKIKVFSASYNSHRFCVNCAESVSRQTLLPAEHFYIDDCSTDDTHRWMNEISSAISKKYPLTMAMNQGINGRKYKLLNLYEYILKCDDDDIICVLDGDDWLATDDALEKISDAYSDPAIRYAYTNWKYSHNNELGISKKIPGVNWNPYTNPWITSAMSTFRAIEFRNIPFENFLRWDYKWFTMGCDQAYVLPILWKIRQETGTYESVKFIDEPLYVYQFTENPNKPRNNNDGGMRMDAHNSVTFIKNRGYIR